MTDQRRGDVVHAPGKRHRPPAPSAHGVAHSDERIAKARAAEEVVPGRLRDKAWGQPRKKPHVEAPGVSEFGVTSPAFADGEDIPSRFTADGQNVSPELRIAGVPEGTKAFAVVMDDPDAPSGTFTHWLLTDVPATETTVAEGTRHLGVAGKNDMGVFGYSGPEPPPGRVHRYFIRVHALRDFVRPTGMMTRASFDDELPRLTIDTAVLQGRYARRG